MVPIHDQLRALERWIIDTGIDKNWTTILLAEEREIYQGDALNIDQDRLMAPENYASRFSKLLAAGYSWVHLNALGTLNGTLVVSVAWPRETNTTADCPTSVNFSHELPKDLSLGVTAPAGL